MPVTTNALFDRRRFVIEEKIGQVAILMAKAQDPVYEDIIVSSFGVVPVSQYGRDLKVIRSYEGSLAGVIESSHTRGDFPLYGDLTTDAGEKFFLQRVTQTYPNPLDGPNSKPYQLGIGMRGILGNLALSAGEHDLDALPANKGRVVANKLKGFGKNFSKRMAVSFYLSQNNDYVLFTIASAGAWTGTGPFECIVTTDNLALSRIAVGDRVDLYNGNVRANDSTGTEANQTLATRASVWVKAVNHMTGDVTFVSTTDPDTTGGAWHADVSAAAAMDDFKVVWANTKLGSGNYVNTAGYMSYFKFGGGADDNFLLGPERDAAAQLQINVITHPEFRSYKKTSVGVLTELKLREFFTRAIMALDEFGWSIDTGIWTDGIRNSYLAQKISSERRTMGRGGQVATLAQEGDSGDMVLHVQDQAIRFRVSKYLEQQTVIGMKVKGNWKLHVPPGASGVQTSDDSPPGMPFEFIGPLISGNGSPRLPYLTTSASGGHAGYNDFYEMPGRMRVQISPDQPPGVRLEGVTDDRTYSE